jgi:hypothetical protein
LVWWALRTKENAKGHQQIEACGTHIEKNALLACAQVQGNDLSRLVDNEQMARQSWCHNAFQRRCEPVCHQLNFDSGTEVGDWGKDGVIIGGPGCVGRTT